MFCNHFVLVVWKVKQKILTRLRTLNGYQIGTMYLCKGYILLI